MSKDRFRSSRMLRSLFRKQRRSPPSRSLAGRTQLRRKPWELLYEATWRVLRPGLLIRGLPRRQSGFQAVRQLASVEVLFARRQALGPIRANVRVAAIAQPRVAPGLHSNLYLSRNVRQQSGPSRVPGCGPTARLRRPVGETYPAAGPTRKASRRDSARERRRVPLYPSLLGLRRAESRGRSVQLLLPGLRQANRRSSEVLPRAKASLFVLRQLGVLWARADRVEPFDQVERVARVRDLRVPTGLTMRVQVDGRRAVAKLDVRPPGRS